jgi:hypothetical protein
MDARLQWACPRRPDDINGAPFSRTGPAGQSRKTGRRAADCLDQADGNVGVPSAEQTAASDTEHLTVHIASLVARQEYERRCQFRGLCWPTHR